MLDDLQELQDEIGHGFSEDYDESEEERIQRLTMNLLEKI